MASRTVSKNNVIAGLFVVASMILAIAISVAVSGLTKRLGSFQGYTVRFPLSLGASGLKPGSLVTLGGQEVGRVTTLAFLREGGRATAVDVSILVKSDIQLYKNSTAYLVQPLLGSMSTINFPDVGAQAAAPLAPGEVISGVLAPPGFLAQAGYGPEQADQVRSIIARAERVTQRLEENITPKVETALDDVNSITSDVRKKTPEWSGRVDSVLAKTDAFADEFKPLVERVNSAVSDADAFVKKMQEAIDANRPGIDDIVANIRDASKKLNDKTIDQVNSTLASAQSGAEEFRSAAARFSTLLAEQTPNLRGMLANLRLAADQLKLTTIEVRRNPWRLLYQPKTKELQAELFYDAARTYAQAVSDLKSASEALEVLSKDPDGAAISRETLQHVTERLDEAFKRYEEAEKDLIKRMSDSKG